MPFQKAGRHLILLKISKFALTILSMENQPILTQILQFLTISTNTLPTPNKKRPPPKPRLLNVKPPKEKKRLNYVASEQIVASGTVAENKATNFDNFSSPNSSVVVAGLSSPEFDTEFEKMNDVNLLNDTDITISTSTDTDEKIRIHA